MLPAQYTYLSTLLAFGLVALAASLLVARAARVHIMRYARLLLLMAAASVLLTLAIEPPALESGAWAYGTNMTLGVRLLGSEMETLVYSVLMTLTASIVTITVAEIEEKHRSRRARIAANRNQPARTTKM